MNWARLSAYDDGTVKLLTCDGLCEFDSIETAKQWLGEGEYSPLIDLIEDDQDDYPATPLQSLQPPLPGRDGPACACWRPQ